MTYDNNHHLSTRAYSWITWLLVTVQVCPWYSVDCQHSTHHLFVFEFFVFSYPGAFYFSTRGILLAYSVDDDRTRIQKYTYITLRLCRSHRYRILFINNSHNWRIELCNGFSLMSGAATFESTWRYMCQHKYILLCSSSYSSPALILNSNRASVMRDESDNVYFPPWMIASDTRNTSTVNW